MVFTKLCFNAIKETTPRDFPTVPSHKAVQPILGRRPPVVWPMNRNPAVKSFYKIFYSAFCRSQLGAWMLVLLTTWGITTTFFGPGLWLYRKNNVHRTLDVALAKENAFKAKKKAEEEAQAALEEEGEEEEAEEVSAAGHSEENKEEQAEDDE